MIFLGDVHGSLTEFYQQVKKFDIRNENVIQVGDFGVGFRGVEEHFNYFHDNLARRNINIYAIRGNHDNPKYFNGDEIFENIHLVPDYTVLNIEDKNILCVGGGISLDRTQRKEFISYWKDEVIKFEFEKLKEFRNIDIVVTHNAPNFLMPTLTRDNYFVMSWCNSDKGLYEELEEERKNLTTMYDIISENNILSHWFYGHFHNSYKLFQNNTNFIGLNTNELHEINKNI